MARQDRRELTPRHIDIHADRQQAPSVAVNVGTPEKTREEIGEASARGFFVGFSTTAGILLAIAVVLVAVPLLIFLSSAIVGWIVSPPDPVVIPVEVPATPEPAPVQSPLSDRVIDFAEKQVAGRLTEADGKMIGRGVIVEADAYGTYLVIGKTDNFTEWKVRLGVDQDRFQIGSIYIGGADRTEID